MRRFYLVAAFITAAVNVQARPIDLPELPAAASEVAVNVLNTVQQSGVERFAPPPQPKGCNAGYMWSTAGGIAHCVPIPPPPPVVTAPVWEPPAYDSGSTGGSGTPVATGPAETPFNWWDVYFPSEPTPTSPTTNTPPPVVTSQPPEVVAPPPIVHTEPPCCSPIPPPVVVAPAPVPPPQEEYVWAIGAPNMGQSVGSYNGAAQYAAGEAYGAGQFAYVSQQYGNGDNVPYPVQTVSEFKASMAASGCWESYYGGWECR